MFIREAGAQESRNQPLPVVSCFIRTYEEADIPALERGMITQILHKEGDLVEAGQILAVLDDAEAKIQHQLAKVQLELAQQKLKDSVAVKVAEAKVHETQESITKSRILQQMAKKSAESTVAIEKARKALATSQADLDRAVAARKEFAGAVSEAEISRLTYMRDASQLEIESAEENRVLAALEVGVESSAVATAQAMVERFQLEKNQALADQQSSEIELESLKLQVQLAETKLQRRHLVAPFSGMLVELYHHRGEWIEPGRSAFRIVRLDRMIVEGFANASQVHHQMRGAKVLVRPLDDSSDPPIEGTLMFVSPEIDPVNQQVQVRALIDNTSGLLRAGQAVEMNIIVK